jgi:hypothetical protein
MADKRNLTDGKPIIHAEDPQQDLWGGKPVRNGRELSAVVRRVPGEKKWYQVRLEVSSTNPSDPLTGKVTFYLHDSFGEPVVPVPVRQGSAIYTVIAFGAFTVGAKVEEDDGRQTQLELDLAYLKDVPKAFVEN